MTILIFFAVLFLLILVHEWGHFIVAKKSGIRVDEFGIGFPPKLFGYTPKGSETEYTFNLFPIGGFVRIFGENPDEESLEGKDSSRSFAKQGKITQALVLVAGVTMNVLFAYLLYVVAFTSGILVSLDEVKGGVIKDRQVVVWEVLPESPAEKAGITAGSLIVGVGESDTQESEGEGATPMVTAEEVISRITNSGGEEISLEINKNGEVRTVSVSPEQNISEQTAGNFAIGAVLGDVATVSYPLHIAFVEAFTHTVSMLSQVVVGLVTFFAQAVTFSADLSQVAGPVGIVALVGDASALGFVYLLSFTAFISLNLAVINMLPFPALDGGRLLFVAIEAIKGSPISPKIANTLNYIGFSLLILLMLAVTYNDILRLFS